MSPESIRRPDLVDARSDIYAFGCLLFFLLTGEHLFDGESVMDVCAKHLHEVPDTMSDRLGHPVDPAIELIVADCLAKDPADRPPSADALRSRIDAVEGVGGFTKHDAVEWWAEYGPLFEHTPSPTDTSMLTVDIARVRTGSGTKPTKRIGP